MEIHDSDPTTDEPTDPWDRATSQFGDLGDRLKSTYRKVTDGNGPTEDEVRQALATLLDAWNQVAGSISEAIRDPETKEELKKAATSLANAVGTTIVDLSTEFSSNRSGANEEEE